MNITKKQEGKTCIFEIQGRLDTSTAPKLHDELLPAFDEAGKIVLDFAGLVYVSSAGLRVLLMTQKAAKSKSVPVELHNVSPDIMEVFEMTGFSNILTIT